MKQISLDKITRCLGAIILAVVTLVAAPGATAQNNGSQIIDRIVSWSKAKGSVAVDYTIKSGGESMAGNMIVSGNKFRVKSALIDSWFDGTTQWTYNPATNEVSITEPTDEEIQQVNPFAIIDAFRNAYNITATDAKGKFDKIVLTPKDPKAEIRRVDISVAKGTSYPSRIVIKLASGEVCVLNMSRFIRGTKYTPETFRYDKSLHPSATVVDLR